MNARALLAKLVYASLGLVAIGAVAMGAGELSGKDWLTTAGAWLTAPATVLMGGAVLVAVCGYLLAGLVVTVTWATSAWRRCRRS